MNDVAGTAGSNGSTGARRGHGQARAQARGLSSEEFVALCERVQWQLFSFVRGIVHADEPAQDIVQDTFVAMWLTCERAVAPFVVDHPEDERRRWLFHVAYRRAIDALRRKAVLGWPAPDRPARDEAEPHSASFEDDLVESEAMRTALAALAPPDVACLLLIVVHRFTAAEVGQIVGASAAAVAKRFARAKQRLRTVYLAQNAQTPAPQQAPPTPKGARQ